MIKGSKNPAIQLTNNNRIKILTRNILLSGLTLINLKFFDNTICNFEIRFCYKQIFSLLRVDKTFY